MRKTTKRGKLNLKTETLLALVRGGETVHIGPSWPTDYECTSHGQQTSYTCPP